MYQENPVYYLKCMYGMLSFNREPWIIFDTEKKGETYQQQCNDGGARAERALAALALP